MEYLFKEPAELDPNDEDLEFQITDLYIPEADKAQRELNKGNYNYDEEPKLYDIFLFGKTSDGHSVCTKVTGFEPYFFVKPPASWGKNVKSKAEELKNTLLEEKVYNARTKQWRNIIPYRLRSHFGYVKAVMRKDFWGFTNGSNFPFLKVKVKSLALFNILKRYFEGLASDGFKLYESNIDPFLRFLHERDIQPCGWVRLPAGSYDWLSEDENGQAVSRAAYNVQVNYTDVHGININRIAPLVVMSFDLECTSSHGDFPVPKKNYRKLAMDLVAAAKALPSRVTKDQLRTWICDAFKGERDTEQHVTIHKVYPKKALNTASVLKRIDPVMEDVHTLVVQAVNAKGGAVADGDDEEEEAGGVSSDYEQQLIQELGEVLPPLQGDSIIQIGTTVHVFGSDKILYRHIATLKSCDEIEGADVECFDTEEDMIQGWKELLTRVDPDIITGYNIFGFDMDYLWSRVRELHMEDTFAIGLGRLNARRTTLLEQRLASSALGDNILKYIDMDGIVSIDMFKVMQRDQKLDSYKLDHVAQVFLGDKKDDLKPREIFEKYQGDATDRCVIAKYCLQDCALVNRLMHKLKVLENNIGMGNVCSVPLSYLFMRGQGVKIFSLVAKECRSKQYLIPVLKGAFMDAEEDESGYEGAIVLEPKEGIYLQDPITVLDYSSLYPSSMIARNLSHDCFVNNPDYASLEKSGITYTTVKYDVYEGVGDKKKVVGTKECTFAQLPNGQKGIIPSILQKLLQQRKNTRKKIEYERLNLADGRVAIGLVKELDDGKLEIVNVDQADLGKGFGGHKAVIDASLVVSREPAFTSFEQAVLDALQLAFKVTANSLYGQIGSRTSPIYWKDIAACTTATGREMIMLAKNFAEKEYGAEVIYGDSVTSYTPVLIKHKHDIMYETMEELAIKYGNGEWIRCVEEGKQDKESCELNDVYSWTENGWTKVHRVIRHELAPHKRIVRVNTHWGVVDVTDDHSLLNADGVEVSPADIKVGDKLLHFPFPDLNVEDHGISVDEARIMGFFCGDGSCGRYNCESGKKASWALNNSDMNLQLKYKALCEKVYPTYQWTILDTIESSGVYKLVPSSSTYGGIVKIVEKYRNLMYYNKAKIVPSCILNSPMEVRKGFWEGLYDADGDKEGVITRIDQKSQISMATIALLGASLGYHISLNTRQDKTNIYRLNLTKNKQRKCGGAVKKLYNIEYDGYVYDLTTENHHFQAGVGKMIVHNTDSVFIRFPNQDSSGKRVYGKDALPYAIANGQRMSKEIKPFMPPPQSLEYEKTFYPFIIFSKKRYVGNLYEDDPNKKPKQKSMGIVLKRRDNAPIVKHIYGGIIDTILNKNDIQASVEFLQQELQKLVDGQFPLEDLVITKTLKAEYKDPTKIAHKVLADRMAMRDPGNKPASNDRIPFVYIRPPAGTEVKLQGDRIEHPEYIREKSMTPDYKFYITNQLQTPISQLYALCVEDLPQYTLPPEYWEQMDEEMKDHRLYSDSKKRKDRITALRMKEVVELLFEPFLCKLEDVMPKRKAAATSKTRKNKTLVPVDDTMPILKIDVKENKEKKCYECIASLVDTVSEATLMEYTNDIPKKQKVTSKQYAFRITAEKCLKDIHTKKLASHTVRIQVEDKVFARTWRNALATAAEMRASLQSALENKDVGLMKELQEKFTFINLVDAMDAVPYTLST